MKARVKLRQPFVLFLILLLTGLQITQPSRVHVILLVAFGGIFIVSWFWAHSLSRNLELKRETRLSWVQVGGFIEERLTISNTSYLPAPYVELVDRSTLPDFNASKITSISAGTIDQWIVRVFCKQRGLFYLGDADLLSADPFGIFEVMIRADLRASILVLPQPAVLPELAISSAGLIGEGEPRRNAPQQTIHASTVREYAQGDSFRLIHWPTTARMSKTFVRLMESAPEGNWWVILDLDQDYMLGSDWESVEEQSVALAASLTDLGLRARKSVGMISNGAELVLHAPQKGETQHWALLETLALAKPGQLSLDALFDKMQVSLGKHHSLLIITASTKVDWIKSMPTLMKRGLIPTVLLMDPLTFDGTESMDAVVSALARQNIRYHLLPRGLIEQPKMESNPTNTWAWHNTPAGHGMPIKQP